MVDKQVIVSIVKKITETNKAPCKKTLQKIVFLIEAKKQNLGCDYGIHFYGPYSSDLDFAVRELCDEGKLKIDYTPTNHVISVADHYAAITPLNDIMNHVIDYFGTESPNELELIATALYVYEKTKSKEKIKMGVKKIKGEKYSEARIEKAIQKLETEGYIAA